MKLLFFDVSGGELLIVLIAALLAFGPKQLGSIARKAGKAMSDLKQVTQSVKNEILKDETASSSVNSAPLPDIVVTPQSIDTDYELAEINKQQDKENEKKESEKTTTI
jgi:TatA/E family protein of Tat protein translocase